MLVIIPIIVCALSIVAHQIWDWFTIDTYTFWLLCIIVLLTLIPKIVKYIKWYLANAKKIKLGIFEIEMKLDNLEKEVEETAQKHVVEIDHKEPLKYIKESELDKAIRQIIYISKDNPKAALMLLATDIEKSVKETLERNNIYFGRHVSIRNMVEKGVEKEIFTKDILHIFKDFWVVRNKVVHGEDRFMFEDALLRVVDIGIQILKMLNST
ncbi:hypothetical protein KAU45_02005 [bacterium]|nr:hypothetical protein [bacterium]